MCYHWHIGALANAAFKLQAPARGREETHVQMHYLLYGDADWQRLKEGALIEIARRSPDSNCAGVPALIAVADCVL
jgi:hypothetical protein